MNNDEAHFQYKSYLFKIAYHLLGEIAEAEDMVQNTFEKWLKTDTSTIQNPKAYLAKMLVHQSLDRLKNLQESRKLYKGTWLPEPLIESEGIENSENDNYTPDYALLVLFEKLNPFERAVFILRECFALEYAEISELTTLSQENCRQVLHRSKEKLQVPKTRFGAEINTHRQLLEAFLKASQEQNLEQLKQILKKDIALYSDGGGKVPAALKPLFGFAKVIRFLLGVMKIKKDDIPEYQSVLINGKPGGLIVDANSGKFDSLIIIDCEEKQIVSAYFIRNPEKIHLPQLQQKNYA